MDAHIIRYSIFTGYYFSLHKLKNLLCNQYHSHISKKVWNQNDGDAYWEYIELLSLLLKFFSNVSNVQKPRTFCLNYCDLCQCFVEGFFMNLTSWDFTKNWTHLLSSLYQLFFRKSEDHCNVIRTHNHLVRKRTFNHLDKLAKWLSCVVSTYRYGAFDCMLLSCHVRVSEWTFRLQIKWLWVRITLPSLKRQM